MITLMASGVSSKHYSSPHFQVWTSRSVSSPERSKRLLDSVRFQLISHERLFPCSWSPKNLHTPHCLMRSSRANPPVFPNRAAVAGWDLGPSTGPPPDRPGGSPP